MFEMKIFQLNGTAVKSGRLRIDILNSKQVICNKKDIDLWHEDLLIGYGATEWEAGEYTRNMKYYNQKVMH